MGRLGRDAFLEKQPTNDRHRRRTLREHLLEVLPVDEAGSVAQAAHDPRRGDGIDGRRTSRLERELARRQASAAE